MGIINNEPINHINTKDILGNTEKAVLNIYFYSEVNEEICRLRDKLNESIVTGQDYSVIYQLSIELDELIAEYYRQNKKVMG